MNFTAKRFDVSKLNIALIVLLAFSTTSCPDGGGGSGPGTGNTNTNTNSTSAFLGNALSFSGQVYKEKWDEDEYLVRYSNFNGNLAILNDNGGNGKITNGKLSYSIGVPTGLRTLNFEYLFDLGYDNFTPSSRNVRGVTLFYLPIDSRDYDDLYRDNYTTIERSNSYSSTYEQVVYVYVENDVTVKGTGWKEGPRTLVEDGYRLTYTETLGNMNLSLKAGWNAVYYKLAETYTFTGSSSVNITLTINMSCNNPSNLKWTIIDYYDEYYSFTPDKSNLLKSGNFPLKTLRQVRSTSFPITLLKRNNIIYN